MSFSSGWSSYRIISMYNKYKSCEGYFNFHVLLVSALRFSKLNRLVVVLQWHVKRSGFCNCSGKKSGSPKSIPYTLCLTSKFNVYFNM